VHRFALYKGRLSSFKSWSRRHGDKTAGGSQCQRQNRPSNNLQNGNHPAVVLPSTATWQGTGSEKKSGKNFQKQIYKSEKFASNKKSNAAVKTGSISASYLGGRWLKYRPKIGYPEVFRDPSSAPSEASTGVVP
jgi:hypothetical protein